MLFVRCVATAEDGEPNAPPNCMEALSRPEATPALSGATPSVAAAVTPVKTQPSPMATALIPGRRSARKVPSTGTCERSRCLRLRYERSGDDDRLVPIRGISGVATAAAIMNPPVTGR